MGRREPNRHLAALLAEADWRAGELASAVNALGAAQGLRLRYDRTAVAHWLTGTRPRPPAPALAAAAFTQRLGRLVTPAETMLGGSSPPEDLHAPIASGGPGVMHQLIELCRHDVDPERRPLLARAAYVAGVAVPPDWDTEPDRPARPPAPGEVTDADVNAMAEMSTFFAGLSERYGGGYARTALAGYLADDVGRIWAGRMPEPVRRELCTATAQLAHLLADMTVDDARPGLAQRYFHLALALAREAGDRRQYAVTLRAVGRQALRLGQTAVALQISEESVTAAGREPDPSALSFLLMQRALARAREGMRRGALTDLAEAERQHSRADSPGGPFSAYPRSGFLYQQAEVLLAVGQHAPAVAVLREALRQRPSHHHRPLALTQARLAETLLLGGKLDVACRHWMRFLDYYPHLRSTQTSAAFAELERRLRPYQRQRSARQTLDRARSLGPDT